MAMDMEMLLEPAGLAALRQQSRQRSGGWREARAVVKAGHDIVTVPLKACDASMLRFAIIRSCPDDPDSVAAIWPPVSPVTGPE